MKIQLAKPGHLTEKRTGPRNQLARQNKIIQACAQVKF